MSKIKRPNINVLPFASKSTSRTIFGNKDVKEDDIEKNITETYLQGWSYLSTNDKPLKSDFEGYAYTNGALISYLFQNGIAEWSEKQEYHKNSICAHDGKIYLSIIDNNVGKVTTDKASWKEFTSGSEGGIFAEDKSTDASKIDLEQKPLKTITEYKDGMQITFRVKNDSVNNMQVQLNGLGYREITKAGVGSLTKDSVKTLIYVASTNSFKRVDLYSDTHKPMAIKDFNDVIYTCKIRVNGNEKTANAPDDFFWGILTVEDGANDNTVKQTLFTDNGLIYTRVKWSEWKPWQSISSDMVWKDNIQYHAGSIVSRNNAVYLCLKDNINVNPES